MNSPIENKLINSSYTYKRTSSTIDNVTHNSSHVRVFRDESTSIFTNVILDTEELLALFLDYTFHRLYSEVISNINDKLINSRRFEVVDNYHIHIKPLVGIERIFLIFKGGTLMKKYFDSFIDNLFTEQRNENFTIEDIHKKYGNFLKPLNFNIDSSSNIDIDIDIDDINTEKLIFKNIILKENFKISDTDYSLYINARLHERYNIIHKVAVELLGRAFDIMTDECDEYFKKVIFDGSINTDFEDEKMKFFIGMKKVEQSDKKVDNTFSGKLLNDLRNFLDLNENIINIITKNNWGNLPIEDIKNFFKNLHYSNYNIYECYNQSQIISLLKYIQMININFAALIGKVDNTYFTGKVYEYIYTEDYDIILKKIKNTINILIQKKLYLLKINSFYTREKFNLIKTKLTEWYKSFDINSDKFHDKFERGYDPAYVIQKIDTYKLNYNKIHESHDNPTELNKDDFIFNEHNSSIILSKNNPIYINDNITIKNRKYHYISFNETIRKTRADGKYTVDFDLMRSKFNIIINKEDVLTKNGEPHKASIPSEFIDVSIPRFEDTSRIEFFKHIIKDGNIPTYLGFKKNPNILINAYSISEVLEDLLYTLFNQNSFEPWLDKKYTKRILRVVTLIIIEFLDKLQRKKEKTKEELDEDSDKYKDLIKLYKKNEIKTIIMFFELCYAISNYIEDNDIIYPYHIVARFLEGFNHDIMDAPNNSKLIEYLKTVFEFRNEWINGQHNKFTFCIHHKFKSLERLILNIILFSIMYKMNNNDLVTSLNSISRHYLQAELYYINDNDESNVHYARDNFKKMLTVIYDYGFKLLYTIDDDRPNIINIQPPFFEGGSNNYYKKYIKYKTKYLKK
jgi:hypothetical protein